MLRQRSGVAASVGAIAFVFSASSALAQSLGAASSFAVAGAAGVTAAGAAGTVIAGDVGASPTASITGFPPAIVAAPFGLHPNDSAAMAAQAADLALFSALSAGACTDNVAMQMNTATFGPGIHCFAATADLAASGNMTLSGGGVYIFRVPTALTANVSSTITLTGVDPCNVFWQVGSAATLNGINFPGNVVAQAAVTLGVGASLTGRALVTAGPVTLSGTNIAGGCSAAVPPPPTCPAITLSPATLPNGRAGVAYTQTITGSGGIAPYTFGVTAGALPAALTLTAAGVLAGTPTTAGSSTFTVRGTDANVCFKDVAYTVVIAAAPPPPPTCPAITLSPATLPNGTAGIAYTQTITGSGGIAPYVFGIRAGALPAAFTLAAAGVLAGTPITAGSSTFTVRGTDVNGCFKDVSYTIVIAAAPPPPPVCPAITLSPATLPNGTAGVVYTQTITGSNGTAPYTFSVMAGALPAGLALTVAGVLAGTPTTAGPSTVTIRGTDGLACFKDVSYSASISRPLAVPVLSRWPMIVLATLLALAGFAALRGRAP